MFRLWRRATRARVSVVIPLYNHASFIAEALASVLAQGPIVAEVVVLDDGSTDDSAAIMERLSPSDPRIRFCRQSNAGAHAAINTALASCRGELLAILNSDDVFMPGRVAALAAALDADGGVDIAASAIAFIDGEGVSVENPWYEAASRAHREGLGMGVALLNGNFLMTTSNLLIRRTALKAVGPFAALRYAHDLDWLLRALALGRRVTMVETPLLRYRMHGSNTIKEDHHRVRAEWAMAAAAYLTTLWDRPGAPPIDWEEAAAARSVLATHQLDWATDLCMAYMRRTGAASLDRSPLLADTVFRSKVEGWV